MANFPYITKEEMAIVANLDENDKKYDLIQDVLYAASQRINQICGRRFDLNDETKTFRSYNPYRIDINEDSRVFALEIGDFIIDDPHQKVSGYNCKTPVIKIKKELNGNWIKITPDYVPMNMNSVDDKYHPYNVMVFTKPSQLDLINLSPIPDIQVEASWGWPLVPPTIKEATKYLSNRYLNNPNFPFGAEGSNRSDGKRQYLDGDIYGLLSDYILKGFA